MNPVELVITGLPMGDLVVGVVNPNETVPVIISTAGIPANTEYDLGWRGTEII